MAVNLLKKNSLALVASLLLAGHVQATELLNSSYDVSRELFAALNPPFEQQWAKDNGGDKLTIKQSHAGSSKQALAILQGLKADVVTYNQVTDVQILHDKGKLIPADWQSRLPNNSSPFYSTMGFLVRKGNPKNIHDWNDLVRSDVKLIFPNPKTSGNARYTYLAAWGAADKADGGDKAKTEQFMTQFLKNVEVFDTGGRGATTTFAERGLGDVLISFESEVNNIRKQYEAQGFEVVIPKTNILAEFPVAWVDKNVQANGTEKAAKAYLNWLYSPQAQTIITDYYYRVNNPEVMDKLKNKFPQTELFRVEDKFGSWPEVMKTHFTPQVVAAYKVTLLSAFVASIFNGVFGLLMAWILTRYRFPGRTLLDALMDLPFALPTAVAGLTLASLFSVNGFYGEWLAKFDIKVTYTWLGIAVAMAFTSIPFVVRTVQPVLEELGPEYEEAAETLGATRWQSFCKVVLPELSPALVAGVALSFTRSLGEFGAVIFIAGNIAWKTEVTSLMIFVRLQEFDYPAASAIASVILAASLLLLFSINTLQSRFGRRVVGH